MMGRLLDGLLWLLVLLVIGAVVFGIVRFWPA